MTDVHVTDEPARSEYVATLNGVEAGIIAYQRGDGVIDLQHTVVRPEAEGRGVGSALMRHALDAARQSGERVIPTCPFVAAFLAKYPEYDDVVAGGATTP